MKHEAYVRPSAYSIFCQFPLSALRDSHAALFGEGIEESTSRSWVRNQRAPVRPAIDWSDPKTFQHIDVHFAMQHEQYHLKHLAASPFGCMLWALRNECRIASSKLLIEWGSRTDLQGGGRVIMPHHHNDYEIQTLAGVREVSEGFEHYLSFSTEVPNEQIMHAIWLAVEGFMIASFGSFEEFPTIRRSFEARAFPEETIRLWEGDLLEGFARCNEYMSFATRFNPPLNEFNRFILTRAHGGYQAADDLVSKVLGFKSPDSFMATAVLCDWALQAPILPFLLRGRDVVSLEELRPASRFLLLLQTCRTHSIQLDTFFKKDRGQTEEKIFGYLDWEPPRRLAQRILEEQSLEPKTILARHCLEGLRHAAEMRLESDPSLHLPNMSRRGNYLIRSLGFFTDNRSMVIGDFGLAGPINERLFLEFLDNALKFSIVDAISNGQDLTEPNWICSCVEAATNTDRLTLLARYLTALLGDSNANRLVEGM